MTGLGLATKGKICPVSVSYSGGGVSGGIIHRDRRPTKKECELLYFPKVYIDLIKMIDEGCELEYLPEVNTELMNALKEQAIEFSVDVKFNKVVEQ